MTRFKSILGFVGGVGARGGNRGLSPVTMRVVRSLLAALLTGIFALPVHADTPDFDIRVSTPKTGGSIDLFLCKPDGITQCSVEDRFTRTKLLMITVSIDITDTALQKAEKIAKALNNRDPNFKAEAKRGIVEEFANVTVKNSSFLLYGNDFTGEHTTVTTVKKPPPLQPKTTTTGIIDFHLIDGFVLAGTDQNGLESQFQSSFGFDGIVADANFSFSALSGNTIDTLLTDIYNSFLADLPVTFWSNLFLDLLNDEISFVFPTDSSSVFVSNFTSDTNAFPSLGLATTTIPEPSTLSLLVFAAIAFCFTRRIR